MSSNEKTRLYSPPNNTLDTLRVVISGQRTLNKIAEELGVSEKTAWNKLHDPVHLDLIENTGEKYEATDEARRLIQLEDEEVLKNRFVELPGVEEVLDRIEKEDVTAEEIGRIISFQTKSGAADIERFEEYGRVYARWILFLDLGTVDMHSSRSQHPLENPRGANNPRVPPQRVIDALRIINEVENRKELADRMGYSERYTSKILTTAYALGVARKDRGGEFTLTGIGRTITTTSEGKQRELFRDQLLEIPLVQAYCNNVPNGEFKNKEIMRTVSKEYNLGWSDGTIETRAKRLYRWLIFTNLTNEKKQGILQATEKMPRGNLPEP